MNTENQSKKIRLPAWIYPKTAEKMDSLLAFDNCKSRSEFMENALNHYASYLSTKDNTSFLSKPILEIIRSEISDVERKMSNNMFRLAAQMGVRMNNYN